MYQTLDSHVFLEFSKSVEPSSRRCRATDLQKKGPLKKNTAKAAFMVKSKNPETILHERRPGKRTLHRLDYDNNFGVEDFEVVENSENFEHSSFCTNQVLLEERVYDFDILNSRDKQAIRKEKSTPTLMRRLLFATNFVMFIPARV